MLLLSGIILAWMFGAGVLMLVIPRGIPGRRALVAGYGLLVGLLSSALISFMAGIAGSGLYAVVLLLTQGALVAAVFFILSRRRTGAIGAIAATEATSYSFRHAMLALILILLIGLHFAPMAMEVIWRPLYPWDAFSAWAPKARVWFEYREILPFVDKPQWLAANGDLVFTSHLPHYPIVTPLLQLWSNVLLGEWNSSLMNTPWLLCAVALALMFWGQARVQGATSLQGLVFVYLLVSSPLLNTHVALAGYADVFMATVYAAALLAFAGWALTGSRWQGALALLFAACCPLIKNEGIFWLLTMLPGAIACALPRRWAAVALGSLGAALALVLLFFPQDLVFAGHSLAQLQLGFRPEALGPFFASLFLLENWHLAFYILGALTLLWLISGMPRRAVIAPLLLIWLSGMGFLFVVFVFSGYAPGAVRFTALNRIELALYPGTILLCLLLYRAVDDPR